MSETMQNCARKRYFVAYTIVLYCICVTFFFVTQQVVFHHCCKQQTVHTNITYNLMNDPADLELQLKRRNGAERAHAFRQRKKRQDE